MDKSKFFPKSDEQGSVSSLNTDIMREMAESGNRLTNEQFESILLKHELFLASGGKGGHWQSLEVAGLTLAVYSGATASAGKQASFANSNLSQLLMDEKNLECSDFVNVYYPNGSFRKAKLKNSIFTDSIFDYVDFTGADISTCDFSRSSMKFCRFNDANLSGSDFENCDLSGSIFTGANTSDARFPGAKLENVLF